MSLAKSAPVCGQLSITFHRLEVRLEEGSKDLPAVRTGGALELDGARVAYGRPRLVDEDAVGRATDAQTQLLALRTTIPIIGGVVRERFGGEVVRALTEVWQGHEGADAVVFQALDVLDGAVGRVAGGLFRSELPAEARPAPEDRSPSRGRGRA